MRPFDPIHSPVQGTCLIEAGAGTGKTYTITTLVLRLVLQQGLAIEQILVVTFTTAATAELRDRLRRRLRDAKRVLQGKRAGGEELENLLARCGPRAIAVERLTDALADFDRMPVFTIHGFCQRVLSEMAFETGSSFEAELITDPTAIVQSLAEDYWRRTWHSEPPEVMSFVLKKLRTPSDLTERYRRYAGPEIVCLPSDAQQESISWDAYREMVSEARSRWHRHRDAILEGLGASGLKANIYGRSEQPDGGPSPRETKLDAWAVSIDRWFRSAAGGFPPPDALVYFSRTKLDASLKKGCPRPEHPFFEIADRVVQEAQRLEAAMQQWLVRFQVRFFEYVDSELKRYKQDHQVLFFDDLLLMVRQALRQDRGAHLQRRLRLRYRAALIDEFQDTDPVQYDIFATLFGTDDYPMFLIGDPKQAIYSFRGADIFTYLKAARHTAQRYTLTRNWRSRPGLINAVNAIFGHCGCPFFYPDIAFLPATPAPSSKDPVSGGENPAMTVWYLDAAENAGGRAAWTKPEASDAICRALAHEMVRLETRGIPCRDMAVLVRTHRQARQVKRFLAAANVPAVVYNAGSVFHRPEALEVRRLLEAVCDPADDVKLRTVLATALFGRRGDELDFSDRPPAWWDATVERFFHYHALWNESFIRMFRTLMIAENIAPRLLAGPLGERRLTNVLHLAELLHQASVERGLGPGDLVQWLETQRRQGGEPAEAHQMRLESDADAVTIMTVHKSKGLEFPVVFCPFAWEGVGRVSPPALCHDDSGGRRVLDFGSEALASHLAAMAEEQMAEELRLLYVAVTRAKQRCYLVWGRLPSSAYSALAYLLDPECGGGRAAPGWEAVQAMAARFQSMDTDTQRRQVMDLVERSDGAIQLDDLPAGETVRRRSDGPIHDLAPPRRFERGPLATWTIASFSSLTHHRRDDTEWTEGLSERQDEPAESYRPADTDRKASPIGPIADFEASARAGLCLHDILERIDFSTPASDRWRDLIEDRLQRYGFARQWRETVLAMLQRVVATPLAFGKDPAFTLQRIALADRLAEMEFHLPLRSVNAAALGRAFTQDRHPAFQDRLPGLMEQLDFSIAGGYLKGYIDLVFRYAGRYFIIDWKSNLLGEDFEAYRPDRLTDVMENAFYFLQYHLYVLALDRYLDACLPGYDYNRHFGGVFYCFIRGMRPSDNPPTGIFFDRPSERLMHQLREAVTNFYQ